MWQNQSDINVLRAKCCICKLMLQITRKTRRNFIWIHPGKSQEWTKDTVSCLIAGYVVWLYFVIPQCSSSSITTFNHHVLPILPPNISWSTSSSSSLSPLPTFAFQVPNLVPTTWLGCNKCFELNSVLLILHWTRHRWCPTNHNTSPSIHTFNRGKPPQTDFLIFYTAPPQKYSMKNYPSGKSVSWW